jgi:hypothetical protein
MQDEELPILVVVLGNSQKSCAGQEPIAWDPCRCYGG